MHTKTKIEKQTHVQLYIAEYKTNSNNSLLAAAFCTFHCMGRLSPAAVNPHLCFNWKNYDEKFQNMRRQ